MLSLWLIFKFQNRFSGFEVCRAGLGLIWWFIVGGLGDGFWIGWSLVPGLVGGWFLVWLVNCVGWLVGWLVGYLFS